MKNTTLYKYVKANKDDEYFLQVIYFLMRKSLLKSNFRNRESISINGKFLPEPLMVDMTMNPSHEMDGLMLLLFVRAIMINSSYLEYCSDETPLFRRKSKFAYEWVDWLNIINQCRKDEDFSQILECIETFNNRRELTKDQIETFQKNTIGPPYRYLTKYYRTIADSDKETEEVIKSNAFVNDNSIAEYTVNESVAYIGDTAFAYCENLTMITILPSKLLFGHFPIVECGRLQHIYVHKDSLDYYKQELPYYSNIISSIEDRNTQSRPIEPQPTQPSMKEVDPKKVEKLEPQKKEDKQTPPPAARIDFDLIYSVFKNVSTSYKYFWFLSLLSMIKRKERTAIPLSEMSAEMMALAWPYVHEYELDLGKEDSFKKIAVNLIRPTPLVEKTTINLVRHYINEHYSLVKKILAPLLENVPYRFLSPWIKFVSKEDVIQKSNDISFACPYAFVDDNIVFDEDWYDYLHDNLDKLEKFVKSSLLEYLKKHNSEMALLKYKMKNPTS